MSLVGSITGIFTPPTPADLEIGKTREAAPSLATGATAVSRTTAPHKSFAAIFDKMVGEVDGTLKAADAEKAKVLSGESTNLHQAMIAVQEAGVAFSLMVEVRNKLVESYQEIMRMQV